MRKVLSNSGEFNDIRDEWNTLIIKHAKKEILTDITKHYIGRVKEELINRLKLSLFDSKFIEFELEGKAGFVYTNLSGKDISAINNNFSFFDLKEPQIRVIKEICESLAPEITRYLRAHFRVLHVKMFRATPNSHKRVGPNHMHTDGNFPNGTQKVLVYLNGASHEYGLTTLVTHRNSPSINVLGPPGTYILFNPCITRHQGIVPKEGNKDILEITLCPWSENIIEPAFGGPNARQPIRP